MGKCRPLQAGSYCISLLVPYKTTRSSGRLKKIDNRGKWIPRFENVLSIKFLLQAACYLRSLDSICIEYIVSQYHWKIAEFSIVYESVSTYFLPVVPCIRYSTFSLI